MINKLTINSGYKDGRSYLKDSYFTRPFRLANIGEDKSDPALYIMVMSSSPGILDNDHYEIDIKLEPNSKLMLESQSYQRLFTMKCGAKQDTVITLGKNSSLSYVPHPIVPHDQSTFKAHNVIHLSDDCNFTFGEIITCGRKHSGEIFRFSSFRNVTEIFHNNKLILKDNILLQPLLADVHTLGQMEGFTHQATLIHINTCGQQMDDIIEDTHTYLQSEQDIAFGVSQPFPTCMIVRILGGGAEQLYNSFRFIQRKLWTMDSGKVHAALHPSAQEKMEVRKSITE